jgi:hypothetical protein
MTRFLRGAAVHADGLIASSYAGIFACLFWIVIKKRNDCPEVERVTERSQCRPADARHGPDNLANHASRR